MSLGSVIDIYLTYTLISTTKGYDASSASSRTLRMKPLINRVDYPVKNNQPVVLFIAYHVL